MPAKLPPADRASGANGPVVQACAVRKRFGERLAVDGVDLTIERGVCFGLLGPNGAGKTTTLRMLYGVTTPSSGSVKVFGIDVTRRPRAVRARIGVTLQENVLTEEITPRENLRTFGRYYLMREPLLSQRIEELIDFLELRSHADVPVRNLSGGFKRRLSIAQSLINRPELLILDEPTTGLDPAVRLGIWARVRDLRAAGSTILLTTHYMDEAERLCDRVAIMSAARVREEGSPTALIGAHLARHAVEIECTAEEEAALLRAFPRVRRPLRVGRRLVVYADDASPLVEHFRTLDREECARTLIVRPANLEDVFLALTGSTLEGPGQ